MSICLNDLCRTILNETAGYIFLKDVKLFAQNQVLRVLAQTELNGPCKRYREITETSTR